MGFPTGIGKVYVKEQSGGWGTEETSFSSADLMSCKAFLPKLVQEALVSETFRGGFHAHQRHAGSREGMEFQLEHTLQGISATTPTADPGMHPDSILLKSLLGGSVAGGYLALAASGHLATAVAITNGALTTAMAGMPILVPCAAALSGRAISWAKTITTAGDPDIITPWNIMPGASATGQGYGARVLYMSLDQPVPITCQIHLGQADGAASVRTRDVVCIGATLELVAGQLKKITYNCKAGWWDIAGSWSPGIYANTYPEMDALFGLTGAALYYGDALVTAPSVQVQMTSKVEPSRSIGAEDGFKKWVVVDREVVITRTALNEDYSVLPAPGTETATGFQLDLGTVPGSAASMFMPLPQVQMLPEDPDASGLAMRKTAFTARPAFVESAGGIGDSPYRFAFL